MMTIEEGLKLLPPSKEEIEMVNRLIREYCKQNKVALLHTLDTKKTK